MLVTDMVLIRCKQCKNVCRLPTGEPYRKFIEEQGTICKECHSEPSQNENPTAQSLQE